jgi:Kelch motif
MRRDGSRTYSSPLRRRGWRSFLVAVVTGLLALAAIPAYAQGTWQTLPSMPTARDAPAGATAPCTGAVDRTCVYAVGGVTSTSILSTVEAFRVEG